jgi:hypothetical protein
MAVIAKRVIQLGTLCAKEELCNDMWEFMKKLVGIGLKPKITESE